jgi:hypothetical protein
MWCPRTEQISKEIQFNKEKQDDEIALGTVKKRVSSECNPTLVNI